MQNSDCLSERDQENSKRGIGPEDGIELKNSALDLRNKSLGSENKGDGIHRGHGAADPVQVIELFVLRAFRDVLGLCLTDETLSVKPADLERTCDIVDGEFSSMIAFQDALHVSHTLSGVR